MGVVKTPKKSDHWRASNAFGPNTLPPNKRSRTSTNDPTLPDCRFFGDPRDHIRADAPTQRQCRMCSYLHVEARNEGVTPLPKIWRSMDDAWHAKKTCAMSTLMPTIAQDKALAVLGVKESNVGPFTGVSKNLESID